MSTPLEANQFLSLEESAAVDQALLPSRDKFLTRVAIYSLRSLKQISETTGLTVEAITPEQVRDWVAADENIRQVAADESFQGFFTQLVLSSLKPLHQIAQEEESAIANLTTAQVIAWFEKEAKKELGIGD